MHSNYKNMIIYLSGVLVTAWINLQHTYIDVCLFNTIPSFNFIFIKRSAYMCIVNKGDNT